MTLSLLGVGTKWQVSDKTFGKSVLHSTRLLLERAMSGSRMRTDVRFHRPPEVCGQSGQDMLVTGHCDVLGASSEVFMGDTYFHAEEPSALNPMIVHIANEIDVVSLKGFLEWVYTGVGGKNFNQADGRALWCLADFYGVVSLTYWLHRKGIDSQNLCSAFEFAESSITGYTVLITKECLRLTVGGLGWVQDKSLSGFGSKAARILIRHQERLLHPKRHNLIWRRSRDVLLFINRLYIENGPSYLDLCQSLVQICEKSFALIPIKVLRAVLLKCHMWIPAATRQSSVLRVSDEHTFEVEYNTFAVCDATKDYNGTIDNHSSGSNLMVAVRNDEGFVVVHMASGTFNLVYTVNPTIHTITSALAAISFDKHGNLYTAINYRSLDEPEYTYTKIHVHAPDGTVDFLLDQDQIAQLPREVRAMVFMSDDCLAISSTTAVIVIRIVQHRCVSQYTLPLPANTEVQDMAYETLTGHLIIMDSTHNTVYVYNGCNLVKHGRVIIQNNGNVSRLLTIASGRGGEFLLAHSYGVCIVDALFNVLQNVGHLQDSPVPLHGVSGISVDIHDRILVQTDVGLFTLSHTL
jgi:hypothetical protein